MIPVAVVVCCCFLVRSLQLNLLTCIMFLQAADFVNVMNSAMMLEKNLILAANFEGFSRRERQRKVEEFLYPRGKPKGAGGVLDIRIDVPKHGPRKVVTHRSLTPCVNALSYPCRSPC